MRWVEYAGGADACGCTACAGSGVMCRVERGSLRSGGHMVVKNYIIKEVDS